MSKKVCSIMKSSINELPDDLLLKILSFLSTKQAVVTSLLSKQWKSLWTKVPRLEYNDQDHKDRTSFEQFIDKSLFLHKFHVLESLYIKISLRVNIGPWIRTVFHHHHCHLRELEIDASTSYITLPHELLSCKTLVVLKLKGELIDVEALTTVCLPSLKVLHTDHSSCLFKCESLQMLLSNCNFLTDLMVIRRLSLSYLVDLDVSWCKTFVSLKLEGLKDINISSSSSTVCLPFLNTLHVDRIMNLDNDSFCRLLSNCPLLSDLTLEEKTSDVLLDLDIVMPCLQKLSIIAVINGSKHLCSLLEKYIRRLAIIAPSFKYFSIKDSLWYPYTGFYVTVGLGDTSKLEYASIFHRIVYLELSLCSSAYGKMLVDLFLCSTNLVVLKLKNVTKQFSYWDHWDMPRFFPKCLLSSLEALEWRGYTGGARDKGMLSYLLNHSICLKTAKIFYELEEKQQSIDDLASMPRGSQLCQVLVLK